MSKPNFHEQFSHALRIPLDSDDEVWADYFDELLESEPPNVRSAGHRYWVFEIETTCKRWKQARNIQAGASRAPGTPDGAYT